MDISAHPPNSPQQQHTIAGLSIPDDIHNLAVTDDRVSTALGFLYHFVLLTSKYLAVPLRYTIVCKWSRSAILFEQGSIRGSASKVVYPLFQERGVIDWEHLDYGLVLLERNGLPATYEKRGISTGVERTGQDGQVADAGDRGRGSLVLGEYRMRGRFVGLSICH